MMDLVIQDKNRQIEELKAAYERQKKINDDLLYTGKAMTSIDKLL